MASRTSATRWIPLLLAAVWLAGCGAEPTTTPGTEPAPTAATPTGGQTASSSAPATTSSPGTSVPQPTAPSPRAPPASARTKGGLNAGTPLRIPLPQDRLTSLKLPEAVETLQGRIAEACGGPACVAVLVQATREEPPEPGQSCDDVEGVVGTVGTVGTVEDELGAPFVETEAGGNVTLLTNIRCEDVPAASPSPTVVPSWESPEPTEPGGTAETTTPPDGGSTGTAETGEPVPDESPAGTP